MATPKVSIIIPVYNTEKYLKRCMDSVTGQTLEDIEIILVDDGSKEECAKLCDEFAKTDPRIQVIHKENEGAGIARNSGLEKATGEYVGFIDSDDYVALEMYEELYGAAKKYDVDLVMSGVCFVGGNMFSEKDDRTRKCFEEETLFEKEDMKDVLLGTVGALPNEPEDSRYGVSVWKNIFRRELIEKENLTFLSERVVMSEDSIFMLDFIKRASRAVGVPGTYYRYCRNEDSFSKSYKAERFEKTLLFLEEIEKRVAEVVSRDEYKIYLDRLIQSLGRVISSQEIMHARDNNIKYSDLKKRLSIICTNDKMRDVLKTYPWYKLPPKQAAFAFAMKHKLFRLQKLMVVLRAG